MLTLFLSRYQDGSWSEDNADYDWRDEREDAAVELIAQRYSDGVRLAIEHTRIQPFPRDVEDCEHFKPLLKIEKDDTSIVPGRYIYLDVPVGAVQRRHEEANVRELRTWVMENRLRLPIGRSEGWCVFSGRSARRLRLQVNVVAAPEGQGALTIRRYGEMAVDETVGKALKTKVTKLAKTQAERRVLLLEHRPFSVDERTIGQTIERLVASGQDISIVDEVWCVEAVPWECTLRFTHRAGTEGMSELCFIGGQCRLEMRDGNWVYSGRE